MRHVQLLAHSIASRIPAMAQDCPVNNAYLIEKEIEAVVDKVIADRKPKVIVLDMSRFSPIKKMAVVKAVQAAVRRGATDNELAEIVKSYE